MEAAVFTKAEKLPFVVSRQILLLLPKEKFFQWKTAWESGMKAPPLACDPMRDRMKFACAYLIEHPESDEALQALVRQHRKYFLDSFVEGHAPKNRWPWVPTEDEFPQWFDVELVSAPHDLVAGPIQKLPDESAALMSATHELQALPREAQS